jgi:hypothetical protein
MENSRHYGRGESRNRNHDNQKNRSAFHGAEMTATLPVLSHPC